MKKEFIVLLSSFIFFLSCKDKEDSIEENKINKSQISLDFPDTVFVNKPYNGRINYKNALDTITKSLDDIKKYRFIEYSYTKTNTINYDEKHLKNIVTDTFIALKSSFIPLNNIQFDKLGVNYIDGMITDEVMIDNGIKNEKGEPVIRIITNEFRVTKEVFVIKNP